MASRLRKLREETGLGTAAEFADKHGLTEVTYRAAENGTRPPPIAAAKRYATLLSKDLKRPIHWLYLMGEIPTEKLTQDNEALLIGKVGAGAEITRLEHPDVLAGIPLPPGMAAPNAAMVEGDSQPPLQDGWIIFYGAEGQGVQEKCIGQFCVVKVKEGPTLLKTLRMGSKRGLWNLESSNERTRKDQRLEWAALVMDIRPR